MPSDVRERLVSTGIGFALSSLSLLILNPFFAILILSLYALCVYDSVKQTRLTLLIFAFALAVFYASRDIWALVGDDAAVYVQRYLEDQDASFASIVSRFFLFPPNNEVLYFSFMWVIGKLFNPGTQTLLFIVYLGQLTLLSVAAYLVSRRYAVIFLFIFFFGISDPGTQIMHLWRASFATLTFMIGTLIYFKENQKTGRIITLASLGFHLTLLPFVFTFEIYNFLKRRTGFFLTVVLGSLVFYLFSGLLRPGLEYILPTHAVMFFDSPFQPSDPQGKSFIDVAVLLVLLAGNYCFKLSPIARFATFSFTAYFVVAQEYVALSHFVGRFTQIIFPITAIPLFEIVMKQSKMIITVIIGLLFVRAMLKPVTEFYSFVLPQHRELFYGVANILVFK